MKPKTHTTKPHKKPRPRKPAWIGTRVTVCGYPIPLKGNDIICQLIPAHEPQHTHAATAIQTTNNKPVLVIYYQETEEIVCLEDV